ncbi:MAG: hypothetical protein GY862_00805 [Gammaproteobacteria bacterium]|nr:hypothetical protein [Gammaproteobacteria bacterium]
MIKIIDVAQAALDRNDLLLRGLVQEIWRENQPLSEYAKPETDDPGINALAAALVELLAKQWEQVPPAWTHEIGPMPEPFFLLKYAREMKNLRLLCERESPEPLKNRKLYAPPNFLEFV